MRILMHMDGLKRSHRYEAITNLLATETIESQDLLTIRLRALGYEVTQSSVSRDLAHLGAFKRNGRYVLPSERLVIEGIEQIKPAGPNLLVLKTETGAAQFIGLKLDQLEWPEIIGTIAGDDTIFIATTSEAAQQTLIQKLQGKDHE